MGLFRIVKAIVQENDINVKDLESFDIEDLEELLGAYVRAHIEMFE